MTWVMHGFRWGVVVVLLLGCLWAFVGHRQGADGLGDYAAQAAAKPQWAPWSTGAHLRAAGRQTFDALAGELAEATALAGHPAPRHHA